MWSLLLIARGLSFLWRALVDNSFRICLSLSYMAKYNVDVANIEISKLISWKGVKMWSNETNEMVQNFGIRIKLWKHLFLPTWLLECFNADYHQKKFSFSGRNMEKYLNRTYQNNFDEKGLQFWRSDFKMLVVENLLLWENEILNGTKLKTEPKR